MKTYRHAIRTTISSALAAATLLGAAQSQATCAVEPYMASICMTAATFCPTGYAEANGQLMSISQNTALFSLIGTTYGGDGKTNFALPDLRSRTPVGVGQGAGLSPVQQGEMRGTEAISLTLANMPAHTHVASFSTPPSLNVSTSAGQSATPAANNNLGAVGAPRGTTAQSIYTSDSSSQVALGGLKPGTISVSMEGGSMPVNTTPPQLGLRYCIAVQGAYPPRP